MSQIKKRENHSAEYWPRMAELCKRAMDYLRANTSIWEDPIYGQGYYAKEEIQPRYEFKRKILRGHAESLGFVIV